METVEDRVDVTQDERGAARAGRLSEGGLAGLLAAGGVLTAIGATSCCVIPFALFGLGITGAWMGKLTALAPYQPIFVGLALACLGGGALVMHRAQRAEACTDGYCARSAARRITKIGLWVSLAIVLVAVAWPFLLRLLVGNPVVTQ